MSEVYIFQIFNLVVGVVGLAIGIGLLLVPSVIAEIERRLDKNFSTEALEKVLHERKNITQVLLKRPKVFGGILLGISFLLVLSSLLMF